MFEPLEDASRALADAAFCQRVADYLDGEVGPADIDLLNAEMLADSSKQAAFVRLCLVRSILISDGISAKAVKVMHPGHADASEVGVTVTSDLGDDFDSAEVPAEQRRNAPQSSLYDAMILPALREEERGEVISRRAPSPARAGPSVSRHRFARPRWRVVGVTCALAAAVAVIAIPAFKTILAPMATKGPQRRVVAVVPVKPPVAPAVAPRPIAVISAMVAADLRGPVGPAPGMALAKGQRLDLRAGAIEITFDPGTVVVVSAPAQIRVVDRSILALDAGSLAAHVPPAGVGFKVVSPTLSVVDLGTDFGVRAGGAGTGSLVSVFKGAVDATALTAGPSTTRPAIEPAVRVTAGHAVAQKANGDSALHETAYESAPFLRSIDNYRIAVPLHGTGADVAFGVLDPNWNVVAGPDGATGYPKPAYAVALPLSLFIHTTAAAKWISTAPKQAECPGGNYTFRTTVALPEFAPQTVSMRAYWAADDWIVDIIVNGVGTAKANGAVVGRASRMQPLSWDLKDAPWRAGDNQVDVIVWNKAPGNMALKLSWAATLCPIVRR